MKFGLKKQMTKKEKIVYSIIFILFCVYIIINISHQDFYRLLIIAPVFIVLSVALEMRWWRNRDRPQFEIKDDKLIFKNSLGTLREYSLIKFNGKVETIGPFGARLKTPNLTEYEDTIYIGVLDKKERETFVNALTVQADGLHKAQKKS